MPNKTILFTQEDQVAFLTFNRPEQMNMLNQAMLDRLEMLISKIKNDPCVRAVVIRGAGEVFMAGTDLYEIYSEFDFAITEIPQLVRQFNSIILSLREMSKPVLAVVHGLASGMGMSLMLAADLVLASFNTYFAMGYSQIGTSPVGGLSFNLPRLIGAKKSMELLFLGTVFDAEEAKQLGLINWCVLHEELTLHTRKIIDNLVNGPTLAFLHTKQLINSSLQNKLTMQMELEIESLIKTIHSRDFKTGVQAYVNKRQPEFEGR